MFLQRSLSQMLISLSNVYLEISIVVLKKVNFPVCLNMLTLYLCIKKEKENSKANYKPVSIFSNLSKIYEKLMYQQLYHHFDSILSPKQCSFRKGHSAQNGIVVILEKFKQSKD